MSQLVQLRLYSRAQHALCGCQHSEAPDAKQRSFLCKSLGWQAGGLLCVTWHAFGKVVFELFSSNVCAPFAQAPPSLHCVLGKVPFLGRQLSALRAFHPVPCSVQRGPHFVDGCSILDLFVCNLEKNRFSWCHVRFRNVGSILMFFLFLRRIRDVPPSYTHQTDYKTTRQLIFCETFVPSAIVPIQKNVLKGKWCERKRHLPKKRSHL